MFYKEWMAVRLKLVMVGLMYVATAGLTLTVWFSQVPSPQRLQTPLFNVWVGIGDFSVVIAAIFCSLDLVSEEVNKGTISFLLTRPISRTRIYLTKLGVNGAVLVLTYIIINGLMFAIDWANPLESYVRSAAPLNVQDAIFGCGLGLLLGLMVFFLGAMISVFASNGILTAGLTLAVLLAAGLGAVYALANWFKVQIIDASDWAAWGSNLLISFIGLSVLFFGIGWLSFHRKAF